MSNTDPAPAAAAPEKKTWSVGTLVYDRKGLVILFALLLITDFVWALRIRALGPISQILLKNHGASDLFNSIILVSIPYALGMFFGPVIGYYSDRCRTRWGRRIPFILVSTPICFLGMIGMALSKHLTADLQAIWPSLTADQAALWILGVSWVIFDLGNLLCSGTFNALINDVVPHSLLGRFYALFRIISLIVGAAFSWWLFGYAELHHDVVFGTIAVIYAVGITAMCFCIKEGEYPPAEIGGKGRRSNWVIAWEYLRNCSTSGYYWLLAAFTITLGFVWVPSQAFVALYAKKLGMPMDTYGKLAAVSFIISMFLAYPLGWLVDRFHPVRCVGAVTAVFTVFTFAAGFLIKDTFTFGVAYLMQNVISGCFWTVSSSLNNRLFPRSQFAQFGIVSGTISGLLHLGFNPLLGWALDKSGHAYEYTFFLASIFGIATMILFVFFYRKFNEYGGVKNYQAPEF